MKPLAVAFVILLGALATACSDGSDTGSSAAADRPTASSTTGTVRAELPGRFTDYASTSYDDPDHWICRPDTTDDPCDGDLDAVLVAADGTTTDLPFERADDPGVDCFYVYPTVSADPTTLSDWEIGNEELFTIKYQSVRLQDSCRLFVPAYRQLTRAGLAGSGTGGGNVGAPYDDVVDAFRTYLAQDNEGRGIVLVGHSQGSVWLTRLLADEIEGDDDLRELLVGAYLPGTSITVPTGEVVGGTFDRTPLCGEPDQVGCVTTWSSWDATGGPTATPPDGEAPACVHPGTVGGDTNGLTPFFPTELGGLIGPGEDGQGEGGWIEGAEIDAPWVGVPGIADGACSDGPSEGHFSVTLRAEPDDPRTDELPLYGGRGADLHLIDVNLASGNLSASLAAQVQAYLAGR